MTDSVVTVRLDEILDGHEALRATLAALITGPDGEPLDADQIERFVIQKVTFYPLADYDDATRQQEAQHLPFRSLEDQCITLLVRWRDLPDPALDAKRRREVLAKQREGLHAYHTGLVTVLAHSALLDVALTAVTIDADAAWVAMWETDMDHSGRLIPIGIVCADGRVIKGLHDDFESCPQDLDLSCDNVWAPYITQDLATVAPSVSLHWSPDGVRHFLNVAAVLAADTDGWKEPRDG